MPSVSTDELKVNLAAVPMRIGMAMFGGGLLLVATLAFAVGRMTAPAAVQGGLSLKHIEDLRPALAEQRTRLQQSREQMSANQLAISRRLGQMQAEVLRLNAAGQKLTELAQLDIDEFDFASPPAIGGPIHPSDDLLTPTDGALEQLEMELELKARQLDVLEHFLMVSQLHSEQFPSGWPVRKGWISSLFGRRSDPFTGRSARHDGIDFAATYGSDVVAVAAGVVSYSGSRSGYGKVVEINHGNGYVTRYGHNSRNLVKAGDKVEKGERIALVGRSGRATGAHVHFEVLVDGQRIDPKQYIAQR